MTPRRAALALSAALWLGAMGMLVRREYRRAAQWRSAGSQLEAIFSEDAPLLVRKGLFLVGAAGESRVGYLETQIEHIGPDNVRQSWTLEVRAGKLPPQALALLAGLGLPAEDLEATLDLYFGRRLGLASLKGDLRLGGHKELAFRGIRRGEFIELAVFRGRERFLPEPLPYDPQLPFIGGVSPFQGGRDLKVGDSWTIQSFHPLTRRPVATLVTVEGRERLEHQSAPVECFVLHARPALLSEEGGAGGARPDSYGPPIWTGWVAPDGRVLREELRLPVLGLRLATVLESVVMPGDVESGRKGAGAGRAAPASRETQR